MKTPEEVKALLGAWPAANLPLALLPVQIQTRYVFREDRQQLLIRVYPDDIHIDGHEEQLTAIEETWARRYWEQAWSGGGQVRRAAWAQIAGRFGARRAAWAIRMRPPANLNRRGVDPAPIFPDPGPLKADDWTEPAQARLLPDRWVAAGFAGGARVLLEISTPVSAALPVSLAPDPTLAPSAAPADDVLEMDEELRWLVDFEAAEQVGMGIRVPQPPAAINLLLVFGVKVSLPPQDASAALEDMLNAHHYTRGLGFSASGTPTNNSPQSGAGFATRDPSSAESYAVEIDPPTLGPASAGALAAQLLGVKPATFAAVEGASRTEDLDARHMQRTLWPVTGGYFLEQILAQPSGQPPAFTAEQIEEARKYFIEFVRHAGPLPVMRVGRQPYGLLPVQSLDLLTGTPEGASRFVRTLRSLMPAWRTAASRAPRLRPGSSTADELVEILRMQPVSAGYRARLVFESQFFVPGGVFQKPLDPELKVHTDLLRGRLKNLRVDQSVGDARVYNLFPAQSARLLRAARVQPQDAGGGELPGAPLAPNYIALIRGASFDDLLEENLVDSDQQPVKPDNLLYLLLRHSLLLAYIQVILRILVRRGQLSDALVLEPSLVNIHGTTKATISRTLLSLTSRAPELRANIHTLTAADEPEAALLDELRESLAHLETLPADVLARQMSGCLDLFAYRLDAWITSLATRRLASLRAERPRGLALAGFGWVEDLRPAPRNPIPAPPPDEEGSQIFAAREPGGFLQAPSLGQAAAAAVLRSGYLTQPGGDSRKPFAVDLSSRRVRLAQWLLDGIRQGQPLEALLGYRFERGLHDRRLDRFIDGFRRASMLAAVYRAQEHLREVLSLPTSPSKIVQVAAARAALNRAVQQLKTRYQFPDASDTALLERVASTRVVDGLALARLLEQGPFPFSDVFPGINSADQQRLESELNGLLESVDALSDALTAESVYQVTSGNPSRAAATVDMVAHGEVQPPDLTFTRTQRAGAVVTHRLAALFSGPAPAGPTGARAFRARAEPRLNAWLNQMFGALAAVRVPYQIVDDQGQPIGSRRVLALAALEITPLDAVYLCADAPPGLPTDLERLVEYHALRTAPPNTPPGARVQVIHERPAGINEAQLGFGEFLEVVSAFRRLIVSSRAIQGRDLVESETEPPSGLDAAELRARANQAVGALSQALAALTAARRSAENANGNLPAGLETLRARLLDLLFLGSTAALPLAARGAGPGEQKSLLEQAASVEKDASARLADVQALEQGFDRAAADAQAQVKHDQDRLRGVFGRAFLALPQVRPANAGELNKAFQGSANLLGGKPLEALSWLQAASRVRPAASRLDAALSYAAALGRAAALELRVAQIPFEPNDRWVGLPLKPGEPFPAGKVSLVAHLPQPFKPAQPLAGLVIDEWVEVIPAAAVTTGAAFQFDAPGARPPQSILLAAAPPGAERWDFETVEQILLETLELARIRAIDPQVIGEDVLLQRLLPAVYVSINLQKDTVSTDFGRALREE